MRLCLVSSQNDETGPTPLLRRQTTPNVRKTTGSLTFTSHLDSFDCTVLLAENMSFHIAANVITERSGCTLTPAASAFSSILSALVGSVINGLSSGWLVAFATGWIAWMAIFRVLLGGSYMFYRSATNTWGHGAKFVEEDTMIPLGTGGFNGDAEASTNLIAPPNYSNYPNYHNYQSSGQIHPAFQPTKVKSPLYPRGFLASLWPPAADVRGGGQQLPATLGVSGNALIAVSKTVDLDRSVTVLGWFSWVYTALYAPTTQIIFATANMGRHDNGAAKIVKGLTIAITALPLCIDCRVRYADKLPRCAGRVFNLTTSISTLTQGGLCALLLVTGVQDLNASKDSRGRFPFGIVAVIYPIFSLIWMAVSCGFLPMRDGGRRRAGQSHWTGYFLDIGAGAFAGIFLAAPAFALYIGSRSNGLEDLQDYLSCETQWWRSLSAVVP